MKKRWRLWGVFLILILLPPSEAAGKEALHEKVLEQVYGDNASHVEWLEDAGSAIRSLQLSTEFTDEIHYTYDDYWMLTGTAEEGDRIDVIVYTVNDKGNPIIWYNQETMIGPSGLYQQKVPLQLPDLQYLLIVVHNDTEYAGKQYSLVRKSEQICSQLLEYELNLYEEYGLS